MNIKIKLCIYITISLYYHLIFAAIYSIPENKKNNLIGKNIECIFPLNNQYSLEHFSIRFQVGLRNILAANPNLDLYLPDSRKSLIIPKQLILPNTLHSGIIINSTEIRLFYYDPNKHNVVTVLPISIGTYDHATPSNWIISIKHKKKSYLDPDIKYA